MKRMFVILAGALFLFGCSDDVSSEEDAERAYVGLDQSVDKAMQLGFDGFNAASSANIDPQSTKGTKSGTLTVSGKVDQGASDNKVMTLSMAMADYSDDGLVTYNTAGTLPIIDLKLSKIPDGTIDGTLNGSFAMSGELEGNITLTLTIIGDLQPTAADATKIERKPGTTHITGVASSDYGDYNVNVTR
jgi:hypothetical protein